MCLGVMMPAAKSHGETAAADFSPNAFIYLESNGNLMVKSGRCEMGQGISTALPSVVVDEMEANWDYVRVEQAEGDIDKYGSQATGGSASIRTQYIPMRKAGAAAKEMLIAAAAKVWSANPKDCYAENHFVIHKPTGKKLGYGELASIAATMPVPEDPALKSSKDFKYIGSYLPRHDVSMVIQLSLIHI